MSDAHQIVTLITGASSGIGAATALRLARDGQSLILHARGGVDSSKIPALEAVAADVEAKGAKATIIVSDLDAPEAASFLIDEALSHYGRLDQIVSNAGFALNKGIGDLSRAELDHSYRVIAGAFYELATAGLPHLAKSSCPRIVAISSFVVDQVPLGRLFPATAAAKGALQAMCLSLAAQVAQDGITVNCVSPGFTEKESKGHSALSQQSWDQAALHTPNGRLAKPADIAAAVAFFLSNEAAHITGQVLRVDGGLSLL